MKVSADVLPAAGKGRKSEIVSPLLVSLDSACVGGLGKSMGSGGGLDSSSQTYGVAEDESDIFPFSLCLVFFLPVQQYSDDVKIPPKKLRTIEVKRMVGLQPRALHAMTQSRIRTTRHSG